MVRIHRDKQLLKLWLDYYSRYFTKLMVFACRYNGAEPDGFTDLKKRYNFELVKLPDEIYGIEAHQKVFQAQRDSFKKYTWTLYSDADEIVVADPRKYDGLRHFMDLCCDLQTFCEGYDVIQLPEEKKINYKLPYLMQRSRWAKDTTRSYNKPLLSRIPTDWDEGFHYIKGTPPDEIEKIKDTGLYLLHLKHADLEREYDFSRINTGTHEDVGALIERSVSIPRRIRRIF